MLNHNYVGTEHLLLGLIHEGEGVAALVLESLGVHLPAVRRQVEEIIGRGQQAPGGHIPFTPRFKKVLEMALREALHLGHNYIGTEHLLVALIREGEGVGAQVLIKLGVDMSRARQAVVEAIGGNTPPAEDSIDYQTVTDLLWAATRRIDARLGSLESGITGAATRAVRRGWEVPSDPSPAELDAVLVRSSLKSLNQRLDEITRRLNAVDGTSS